MLPPTRTNGISPALTRRYAVGDDTESIDATSLSFSSSGCMAACVTASARSSFNLSSVTSITSFFERRPVCKLQRSVKCGLAPPLKETSLRPGLPAHVLEAVNDAPHVVSISALPAPCFHCYTHSLRTISVFNFFNLISTIPLATFLKTSLWANGSRIDATEPICSLISMTSGWP